MANLFIIIFLISCLGLLLGIISPSISLFWMNREVRTRGKVVKIYSIAIIASFIIALILVPLPNRAKFATNNSAQNTSVNGQENIVQPQMPASERQFIQVIDQYAALYSEADNELKKSKVWKQRDQALEKMRISKEITDWIGTIDNMGTNGEGKAYITIRISSNITISTMNNAFSDTMLGTRTLIPQSSPLFDTLINMKEGQTVKFSAFIQTLSNLTEAGKVQEPNYIATFSKIELAP